MATCWTDIRQAVFEEVTKHLLYGRGWSSVAKWRCVNMAIGTAALDRKQMLRWIGKAVSTTEIMVSLTFARLSILVRGLVRSFWTWWGIRSSIPTISSATL